MLVELANEVGVPREEANSAFSNISLKQEVLKDEASAHAMGASGVPLFIVNGKYSISGAQSVETFKCISAGMGRSK